MIFLGTGRKIIRFVKNVKYFAFSLDNGLFYI
jgi:hypothetical protein